MTQNNISRGLRNNNPGNIRFSSVPWLGEVRPSQDCAFCQFCTMAYGYRALIKLLRNYRLLHGCLTVGQIITRWAPPRENYTTAYIDCVCQCMHISSTYQPDIDNPDDLCALASAISLIENGVPAIPADVEAGWELL